MAFLWRSVKAADARACPGLPVALVCQGAKAVLHRARGRSGELEQQELGSSAAISRAPDAPRRLNGRHEGCGAAERAGAGLRAAHIPRDPTTGACPRRVNGGASTAQAGVGGALRGPRRRDHRDVDLEGHGEHWRRSRGVSPGSRR